MKTIVMILVINAFMKFRKHRLKEKKTNLKDKLPGSHNRRRVTHSSTIDVNPLNAPSAMISLVFSCKFLTKK